MSDASEGGPFLLFAFEYYYPSGGWNDFVAAYNDLDDAIAAGMALPHANAQEWHVVDVCDPQKLSARATSEVAGEPAMNSLDRARREREWRRMCPVQDHDYALGACPICDAESP